jgi:hypothetical protein
MDFADVAPHPHGTMHANQERGKPDYANSL